MDMFASDDQMRRRKSYTPPMRGRVDIGWRLSTLALAWLAGVAMHLQQRSLWPVWWCACAVIAGALGLLAAWRWRRGATAGLAIVAGLAGVAGAALLATGVCGWQASERFIDDLRTVARALSSRP